MPAADILKFIQDFLRCTVENAVAVIDSGSYKGTDVFSTAAKDRGGQLAAGNVPEVEVGSWGQG